MSEFTTNLFYSLMASGLLTSALIWLSKSWISERLKNAIKNEYAEKLETHKAQLKAQSDTEAERLRSQLNMAAHEHQIRFSGLHNRRAEVIAEVYGRLVQAKWDANSFTSPMQWTGEPTMVQKHQHAMNSLAEFFRFFEKNRIYLPEQLCSSLESFAQEMRKRVILFGAYLPYESNNLPAHVFEQKEQAWQNAWKYFAEQAPAALKALEDDFRKILGAESP